VANPWRFAYDCLSFDVLDMAGRNLRPQECNGNLVADVTFTMGNGCGKFDYGYVGGEDPEPPGNAAPDALAKVTPKVADKRRTFTFDARGSTDAETPANLDYSWNFGDGGVTKDAVGPVVRHKFTTPGVSKVTLTVTDPRGARDTKELLVMVTQTVQCAQAPVQKTGAGVTGTTTTRRSTTTASTTRTPRPRVTGTR
jgi:PKD repeat protein